MALEAFEYRVPRAYTEQTKLFMERKGLTVTEAKDGSVKISVDVPDGYLFNFSELGTILTMEIMEIVTVHRL